MLISLLHPSSRVELDQSKGALMVLAEFFGPDLIIVIVVLLVLAFAGPRLARNLGTAKKEFEKSMKADPKNPDDQTDQ